MDLVLVHQCSASAVSMYIVTANLFSAEHVFASKILSRSFSHCVRARLPVALHGMVFQEVLRTLLPNWWWWLRAKHRGSRLSLPAGGGPPYAAYVHPRQPHVQPPSAASLPTVAQATPPVAASLPHVVALSLCFAASWQPPSPLLPWRYRASHLGTIVKSYEEVP